MERMKSSSDVAVVELPNRLENQHATAQSDIIQVKVAQSLRHNTLQAQYIPAIARRMVTLTGRADLWPCLTRFWLWLVLIRNL